MKLYNTLTRQVEPFTPLVPGEVSMYTCGPTVYNFAHIGNLRTYISEDLMVKTLEYLGYKVNRVMNITDVGHLESDADDGEDKMLLGAQRENKTVWEIAQYYTDVFFEDCDKLMIKRPSIAAKATDFIEQYIQMIQTLEAKGFTYFINGNVYFDITKFPRYTELSKMDLEALQTANRESVTEDLYKRNPQDFVLWFTKSKFENQAMKWESPWGVGYPGWHIECSAIALHYLGDAMDIHCGGVDHIAVHHTNEIAQTESLTGKKWVNYWTHMAYLIDQTGKMSKSKGEFLTLALLERKGYSPLVYRYYVLNSHYRKQLAFSFESLDMAVSAYEKLKKRVLTVLAETEGSGMTAEALSVAPLSQEAQSYDEQFRQALANDYNSANAITVVFDVLKATELSALEKVALIARMDSVLSLDLLSIPETEESSEEDARIEALILERQSAKAEKNYARADAIRAEIDALGYVIEDSKTGTTFRKK